MFDTPLEQATADVWIDRREYEVIYKNGVTSLNTGFNHLTYDSAVELITQYHRLRASVSHYEIKRFDTAFKGIMYAFGPEFCERHAE